VRLPHLAFIFSLGLLTGCGEPATPDKTPAEDLTDAKSRSSGLASLHAISDRFGERLSEATSKNAVSVVLADLQQIRRDLDRLWVSACLADAKRVLADRFDWHMSALRLLMDDKPLPRGGAGGLVYRLAYRKSTNLCEMSEGDAKREPLGFKEIQALLRNPSRYFFEVNRTDRAVTTTASGLQYEILTAGNGKEPSADDTVKVHYRGTLLDGTEFDSSYARGKPVSFPVSAVIPGWTEALQLMAVGSQWNIFIPSELAYGAGGAGDVIPPNAALVFEVELLSIESD
jgi:hypothetical protein